MRLTSLPFSIDNFYPRQAPLLPVHIYFLTHAHRDHLRGLNSSFPLTSTIYSTAPTAAVAQKRTNAPRSCFKVLVVDMTTVIDVGNGEVVKVTPIDAKHCLGSCMFLFESEKFGRVLHTGDFRFGGNDEDWKERRLVERVKGVDWLWMDCTYANPKWKGEHWVDEKEVVRWVVEKVEEEKRDVFIGADGFGKEDLYVEVARALGQKIVMERSRWEIVDLADGEMANRWFTWRKSGWWGMSRDAELPAVRVLSFWKVNEKLFKAWPLLTRRHAVALFPTGCSDRLRIESTAITVLPYTSHCNFTQLEAFVKAVEPVGLAATPETIGFQAKDGIVRDPVLWFGHMIDRYVKGDILKPDSLANVHISTGELPIDLDPVFPIKLRKCEYEARIIPPALTPYLNQIQGEACDRLRRKTGRQHGASAPIEVIEIQESSEDSGSQTTKALVQTIDLEEMSNHTSSTHTMSTRDQAKGYSQPSYIFELKKAAQHPPITAGSTRVNVMGDKMPD